MSSLKPTSEEKDTSLHMFTIIAIILIPTGIAMGIVLSGLAATTAEQIVAWSGAGFLLAAGITFLIIGLRQKNIN
jgi:hypothetical protein